MIAFIDDHRSAYGVDPICKVLPFAPSTYREHVDIRCGDAIGSDEAGLGADASDRAGASSWQIIHASTSRAQC